MDTDANATDAGPPQLRLAVVDAEDLAVVSAHLQNSEASTADMTYVVKTKRFALVVSRFDWTLATTGRYQRCLTGLHFERVLTVASSGIDPRDTAKTHDLLAVSFHPEDAPSGNVLLTFAGGGVIRLKVEVLEAELRDLDKRWAVEARPGLGLDG